MSATRLTTSVVVVTRDRPRQIARLLESLIHQSVAPDEVVVVDNASRESYADVLAAYTSRLPLRVVREETPGIPWARNRGIAEARGEIVLFIDDDCEADAHWLENLVRPFYRDPHIGAVGGEIQSTPSQPSAAGEFAAREGLLRQGARAPETAS